VSEPKFLRTTSVVSPPEPKKANRKGREPLSITGKKPKTESRRELKRQKKIEPRVVRPADAPSVALSKLRDAWQEASAAQLAGTPIDSPVGQLIYDQIERMEAQRAAAPEPVELVATGNIQDDLVNQHRVDIAETRRLVMALIAELDALLMLTPLFTLIADVCNPVDEDGETQTRISLLRQAFYDLIALPSRTDLALKLANSLRALVPLERQAAGLPDGYVDAATERAKKEAAATVTMVAATSFDAIRGRFDQVLLKLQKPAVPA
jgi:hypothetical protein